MKIMTAAQMREVDRLTIEGGIPGLILMENAASRVVEFLAERFRPLSEQRIVVLCGKGNNGGDGLAIARQLFTRFAPKSLHVVLAAAPDHLKGDAFDNLRMLQVCGCDVLTGLTAEMQLATLVIDALLGTGLSGPAEGLALEMIEEINSGFPYAKVVAVDVPSGMSSDEGDNEGSFARADATVTFTALKVCHALAPNCDRVGEVRVGQIGSPRSLHEDDPALWLSLIQPEWFKRLFGPRPRAGHKGHFGHVMTVAGGVGKAGAAVMTGMAALRSGAGLVTVASAQSAISSISAHAPELMTEPLYETEVGSVAFRAYAQIEALSDRKNIIALGPGMGTHPDTVNFVKRLFERMPLPTVVDADGLNALVGSFITPGGPRVLTPHPGELARLCGYNVDEIQSDRIGIARRYAVDREVTVVLKGQRTVIAFPDGRTWINPTGTPAMATAGSGDILTGMIAGLLAQHPEDADFAIGAAVWLHGRCGELGAAEVGEKCLIATDMLRYLPEAIRGIQNVSHQE